MNQLTMIDEDGRTLRDAGMQQAIDHAEAVDPGWKEKAYEYLTRFVNDYAPRYRISEFMAEDVRAWAHQNGLSRPPHSRAWGGIFAKAAKAKLIVKVRIGQVKNKTAHCANAAVWEKQESSSAI